jgi:hypothetical protein
MCSLPPARDFAPLLASPVHAESIRPDQSTHGSLNTSPLGSYGGPFNTAKLRGKNGLSSMLCFPPTGRKTRQARLNPTSAPCGTSSAFRTPEAGKRNSAVRPALGLCEKAYCDRLGDRIACGSPAGVRVTGNHCEGSDTSTTAFYNRVEHRLQDSLFSSTKHAEVNGGRKIDRLLNHGFLPRRTTHVQP